MKNFMLALVIVLAMMSPCVVDSGQANDYPSIDREVIVECWDEAKRLGEAPATWDIPDTIILDPVFRNEGKQRRLLGHYYIIMEVDKHGNITAKDRIYVYLSVVEVEKYPELLKEILTHEMLHSIWQRMAHIDHKWAMENPDSESWVRHLMGQEEGIVNWENDSSDQ